MMVLQVLYCTNGRDQYHKVELLSNSLSCNYFVELLTTYLWELGLI